MAKKDERPKLTIITPKGIAIYPKLNTPSTKFNPAGVYECKLRIDPAAEDGMLGKKRAAWSEIVEAIEAQQAEFLAETKKKLQTGDGKAKAKAKTLKAEEFGSADVDDDGNETGLVVIKGKMVSSGTRKSDGKPWKRKPDLFDARGRKMDNDTAPLIFGGSELKLAIEAVPYYMPKENVVGTSLYLNGAQVVKLVSGNGSRDAGSYGFGEEEGYEFEGEESESGDGEEAGVDDDDIPF